MPIAKFRGMGIYVDPILLLLLAFLVVMGQEAGEAVARLILGAVLVGSVLAHELGHACVARWRGLAVSGIYLHLVPFAYVERGKPSDEWRVALGGPLTSLSLGAVLTGLVYATHDVPAMELRYWLTTPLCFASVVNLAMGLVNLVPALPLDGGRALRALLRTRGDWHRAARLTAFSGALVGIAVAFFGLVTLELPESGYVALLGAYLCYVALREYQGAKEESSG
jgi:Zn-dependent protease